MVRYQKAKEDKEPKKVTFYPKEATVCPICETVFKREELFQGRVNAGELTDELHRLYIPMAAFGEVFPLNFEIITCPSCYFSAFKPDFQAVTDKFTEKLRDKTEERIKQSESLFPVLDFQASKTLREGAASYFLAMLCYESFTKDFSPTGKQAICALRASWCFSHLDEKYPKQNYEVVSVLFKKKALFLYQLALEYEQKKIEAVSSIKNLGPDTDKNYGYEGILYLIGLLEYKYGDKSNIEKHNLELDRSVRAIAKMFGLGKKTKSKPGPLLEKARDLYDKIKIELNTEDELE